MRPIPTLAAYLPPVRAAASHGARRTDGPCWDHMATA